MLRGASSPTSAPSEMSHKMYSQRLPRIGELWEDLTPWPAAAFWVAVLGGAVAVVEGPKWLYVSLVIVASCISAWILLRILRFYWRDFLRSLLSKTQHSNQTRTALLSSYYKLGSLSACSSVKGLAGAASENICAPTVNTRSRTSYGERVATQTPSEHTVDRRERWVLVRV
jgi:hypothetical protein